MEEQKKVVISLSGGMDSATLLGYYKNITDDIICVNFTYGSKHNPYEIECARKLAKHYNVELIEIDATPMFANMKSNLLMTGGEIPNGHYEDKSMALTVVPGRNTIFAATLCGIAESNNYNTIALGVHLGDRSVYSDCRPEYIDSLKRTIELASDNKVTVEAPFITTTKTGILKVGKILNVPYEMTRTCYKNQEKSCKTCVHEYAMVLMADMTTRPLKNIKPMDEVVGIMHNGDTIKFVKSIVTDIYDKGIKDTTTIKSDLTNQELPLTLDHEAFEKYNKNIYFEQLDKIIEHNLPIYSIKETKKLLTEIKAEFSNISIVSTEECNVRDITTTTGNFIANGFVIHNCGSCHERLEAFRDNDMNDPIFYEED